MSVQSEELGSTGTLAYPSRIRLPYTWHVGKVGSRFYEEIKDRCKICGTKCSKCGWVFVPPRETCPRCYRDLAEWVEVSDTGSLLTYTVVTYAVPGIQPLEPPFAIGIIKLDGATSGFVHLLGEVNPNDISIGMKVKAVFREVRRGDYLDIKYFKPLKA
jgi:hypothetical protein